MNHRTYLPALVAASVSPRRTLCSRKWPRRPEDAKDLVVRVYPLGDMILPLPNHSYRPDNLPTTPSGNSADDGRGTGAGGFGGGGGGFGGGSGGAAFNVQAGGVFGGQTGAIAGGLNTITPAVEAAETNQLAMDEIADMIRSSIQPNTWDIEGGYGSITSFRSLLVINQTATVHEKIGAFLEVLREKTGTLKTVTVAAHWLLLDSDQLDKLQVEKNGVTSIDRDELKKLTKEAGSHRGQITCFSGQTVHLVGGLRRNVVTSVIPVVGGDNPAYQPRGGTPNMGVLLQVRPTLVADASATIIDLESWVTAGPKKDAAIDFYSSNASGNDATGQSSFGGESKSDKPSPNHSDATVRVDRLDINSQALATTLRAPVGTPVLAGGLSMVSKEAPADGKEQKQLYLVVQVNVAEYSGDSQKAIRTK